MSLVEVVLIVAKIVVMLGFFLNAAAIATWADRRQSAMIQDRVGPNRAVIQVPGILVRLLVLLPPTVIGVFAILPAVHFFSAYDALRLPGAYEVLLLDSQFAILVAWASAIWLGSLARRNGTQSFWARLDPRSTFYAGLGAHLLGLLLVGLIPLDLVVPSARAAGTVFGTLLLAVGFYASTRVPDGPVPVRLAGTLHAIADTIKMIVKEDFVPRNADRVLHALAPMLAVFPALVTMAVIPFGMDLCVGGSSRGDFTFQDLARIAPVMGRDFVCHGHTVKLQIADLNVGILYLFAMAGTGVIGAAIAGWASDNKFSLLGGLRAASQMVSYEVAMGLSLVGLFLVYGSVRLGPMVEWQGENAWGIFVQPVAFFLFLAALAAETKRVPFDQPEGESEIVAGYFVEYSGFKWGMFMTGEYVELVTSSALLVTLFFGGYRLPFLHHDGLSVAFGDATLLDFKMNHLAVVLISVVAFFAKTVLMTWFQIFFRWTLPRFRYDQVMKLGWTKLLPLALANMMLTGVVLLAMDQAGAGFQAGLKIAGDVTQALVVVLAFAGVISLVAGMLEPTCRKARVNSSTTRMAAATGGTKPSPQQA